jgi:diaminohydroxyphosphoribosylaminopyrimidine deaminase / 5-amino-6-(5-phosphoribosylamino)uracil reductase
MTAGLKPPETHSDDMDEDARFMAAALAFARHGFGQVAPNPAVGALLVKDGVIVGRGHTRPGGRPHAESEALRQAGAAAVGATLYVTLEPCSHHGKTPPCAEAIIAAGVTRVVSALEDPDRRVAGRGHQRLVEAGIDLRVGVLAAAARRTNLGHILRVTVGRPMVTLKLAETADGFAAAQPTTARLAITGPIANSRVHIWRAQHDAIMIGIGTVIADDPHLTVRFAGSEAYRPLRIVLDTHLALPPMSHIVKTAKEHPTLVVAAEDASVDAASRLASAGVEILRLRRGELGHVDLAQVLTTLGKRGMTRIFSEGGPRLAKSLLAAGAADEVIILSGDKPLAQAGIPALDEESRALLEDPVRYRQADAVRYGEDLCRRFERID